MRNPDWKAEEFWRWAIESCKASPSALSQWFPDVSRPGWEGRKRHARLAFKHLAWPRSATRADLARLGDEPPDGWPEVKELSQAGSLAEAVRRVLKGKKRTLEELCDLLDSPPKVIRGAIAELEEHHVLLEQLGDAITLGNHVSPRDPFRIDTTTWAEDITPIGVISDMHYGSKYAREDVVEALYDRFAAEGVEDVYVCGNWIDGESRFNKQDLLVHGMGNQVEYFVEHLPRREGITTHVLSGDDHEGWYVQREGLNIGHLLEDTAHRFGRYDITDLGYMERLIEFAKPEGVARMAVVHPGGGSSYATSYAAQKWTEALQGGEKPNIALLGHYHKYDVSYPREVYTVQPGCCCDQTPFMRKRKLQAHVGGVVMWLRQNDLGIFTSIKHEWFPFYDREFYAYQW